IAKARVLSDPEPAQADFRRSFYLEPNSAVPPWEAGNNWIGINTELAVVAWREALRRTAADARADLYRQMLELSRESPETTDKLWDLTDHDTERELSFLASVEADLFVRHLHELLESDPALRSFSSAQKSKLFALWWAKGDRADLEERLVADPQWLRS